MEKFSILGRTPSAPETCSAPAVLPAVDKHPCCSPFFSCWFLNYMSATGGPLDVPAPPSGLTAADLLQKLQMSRAAQHAAVALAASKASASASSETANPLMRAFALRPSSGGGGGGNSSSSSKGGDGEKGKRHSPLGFNSFMLEGLAGWRTELLSRRLRQAVVTEFCASGA